MGSRRQAVGPASRSCHVTLSVGVWTSDRGQFKRRVGVEDVAHAFTSGSNPVSAERTLTDADIDRAALTSMKSLSYRAAKVAQTLLNGYEVASVSVRNGAG